MRSSLPVQTGRPRQSVTRIPTICVVDPFADDYQDWDALTQANGARACFVASADEALRLARTTAIDLWVISMELPGLGGSELCQILKDRWPTVPAYLLANDYSPETELAAWQARATLFGCRPNHHDWLAAWLCDLRSKCR